VVQADVVLTVAESKRLIAKGITKHPAVVKALREGIICVAKGSTNGYVVEELTGQRMDKTQYMSGRTLPAKVTFGGRLSGSIPDIILRKGVPDPAVDSKSIITEMGAGDVYLKGANALNYGRRQAALLIGHPTGGTIGATIGCIIARRVKLIIPVGLEKSVPADLRALSLTIRNAGDRATGAATLWPLETGEIFTEIEALGALVPGLTVMPLAAGGIGGAEGSVRLLLDGAEGMVAEALRVVGSCHGEPPFIS
jgi:hypothetical protein